MDLLTPLETYCRLILRAREVEAQVPAEEPDEDPDDVDDLDGDDDGDGKSLSVLEEELDETAAEEVRALLDDLAEDQLSEALALAWVGLGTFDSSEWDDAVAEAEDLDPEERIDELVDMPTLASNVENGLAAFDYSCEDIGQLD